LSTQDDVAAHLVKDHGIKVFAIKGKTIPPTTSTSARPWRIAPTSPWTMARTCRPALHMIALNRLDDLAPPVRRWGGTLFGAEPQDRSSPA